MANYSANNVRFAGNFWAATHTFPAGKTQTTVRIQRKVVDNTHGAQLMVNVKASPNDGSFSNAFPYAPSTTSASVTLNPLPAYAPASQIVETRSLGLCSDDDRYVCATFIRRGLPWQLEPSLTFVYQVTGQRNQQNIDLAPFLDLSSGYDVLTEVLPGNVPPKIVYDTTRTFPAGVTQTTVRIQRRVGDPAGARVFVGAFFRPGDNYGNTYPHGVNSDTIDIALPSFVNLPNQAVRIKRIGTGIDIGTCEHNNTNEVCVVIERSGGPPAQIAARLDFTFKLHGFVQASADSAGSALAPYISPLVAYTQESASVWSAPLTFTPGATTTTILMPRHKPLADRHHLPAGLGRAGQLRGAARPGQRLPVHAAGCQRLAVAKAGWPVAQRRALSGEPLPVQHQAALLQLQARRRQHRRRVGVEHLDRRQRDSGALPQPECQCPEPCLWIHTKQLLAMAR